MDSIEHPVDPEMLAALVDGRLSAEDRAQVLKQLAESDEALAVFAHLVHGVPVPDQPKVVPIRPPRRWIKVLPFAAAAALPLAAVTISQLRVAVTPTGVDLASAVTAAERGGTPLAPGWDQRSWTVLRGGAASPEPARARREQLIVTFRLGVRALDLQVALAHRDVALAGRLTGDMLELLKTVGFSDIAAADYSALRTTLGTQTVDQSIDKASRAEKELGTFLKSFSFDFGKWVGAAELAARSHNASFFTDARTKRFVGKAINNEDLTREDVDALHVIAARTVAGPTNEQLDEMRGLLQEIILRHGG